ncbi:hypothetical protein F0224_10960 [Vibrio coralliilyticus]|nr:hypothetical protein [Vibrio coralliilyticus]
MGESGQRRQLCFALKTESLVSVVKPLKRM